ncbi:MAG: hypothetical protein FWG82_03500 [Oscillospiraceae bacterium]|nr:hypothetical protein [Oscillospiraceae bacterium]
MKKSIIRTLALVLAVFMFLFQSPLLIQGLALDSVNDTVIALSADDIPEVIDEALIEEKGHIERLYDEEDDLHSIVFANDDGSETLYLFDEPVKYIDDDGEVADKSNELFSEIDDERFVDYAYATLENDVNTYFPEELKTDEGVSLDFDGVTIEMYPVTQEEAGVQLAEDENAIYYDEVFGEGTSVKYEPQFGGFKEEIIIEENVGNVFRFILEAQGLTPVAENGGLKLVDPVGEAVAEISPIFVYDSIKGATEDGADHFTSNNQLDATVLEDGKFELVITVDEEFLSNPGTVYPVTIDPTVVTINATGSGSSKTILDTPVYNKTSNITTGSNPTGVVGFVSNSYGSGRLLMRFPGLMSKSFMTSDYSIKSAFLTLKECSGGSASGTIHAYNYTGPAWTESTVYSSSVYNGVGTSIASQAFSYPNSTLKEYNISEAVRDWKASSAQGAKGIIFKNTTSETDASKSKSIYTAEGSTKPVLTVTYFYNGKRGTVSAPQTTTQNINCLIYAFDRPETWTIKNRDTFSPAYFTDDDAAYCSSVTVAKALALTKTRMKAWLNAKFPGKWYEVGGYSYTIASDEWMVAMRVGVGSYGGAYDYDYHFWYRAKNGTWYNKHGWYLASEKAYGQMDPANSAANTSYYGGWNLGNTVNYYSSATVFYVIKK